MSIRLVSAAILILAAYIIFQGGFSHANVASADGFVNGVIATVGDAIKGVAETVGRALAWG